MKLLGKKKPLRTSDGRLEMRNPDQILKDAAADISKDLPTKGQKLDLDTYFRSGGADRIANRLLKDNGVLPRHLQDRKDAEEKLLCAQQGLENDIERLIADSEQIIECSLIVQRFCDAKGLPFPFPYNSDVPDGSPEPTAREADFALDLLIERSKHLNQRRMDTLTRYRDDLLASNQATDQYHKHIAATGQLMPVYPTTPSVDVENGKRGRISPSERDLV
jgi:hypothetical protein